MSIASRTVAEVYTLTKLLGNVNKAALEYRSNSRNPALVADLDTALAALKVELDATIADVTTE